MTLRQWLFDVAPSGTALSTANMLAEGGQAASTVQSGAFVSSSAHFQSGGLAARVEGNGTQTALARLSFPAANARGAVSFYHYMDAVAAVDIVNFRHASGQLFRLSITGGGAVQLKDSTGVAIGATATGAWVGGRWNRIEVLYNNSGGAGAGVADIAVFDGDGTTPAGTYSTTTANLGTAPIATLDFGAPNAAAFVTPQWFDSFQMNDGATAFIGPYVEANEPPQVTAGPTQTVASGATVTLSFAVTDVDGTVASRATTFDYPTSGAPTVTGGSTNAPSFTAGAAGSLYRVRHTATDNDGATAYAVTEIRVPKTGAAAVRPLPMDFTNVGGAWTKVGGATTHGAALADESDATYNESPALSGTEVSYRGRLEPREIMATGKFTRRYAVSDGTANSVVRLYEGTTLRQTWTQAVTSTPTNYEFALSNGTLSAITDWGNLYVELGATV